MLSAYFALCVALVSRRAVLLSIAACFPILAKTKAKTYYVSTNGVDTSARDGQSWNSAWKTLAYACEQVPAGAYTIQLGRGKFIATNSAYPQSGITIVGMGGGANKTQIVASTDWLVKAPCEQNNSDQYLIVLNQAHNVTIDNVVLASSPQPITGAIYASRSNNLKIHDVVVKDFRWAGMYFELLSGLEVYNCNIENASTEKCRFHNGMIRTKWIKHSQLHHNRLVSTIGGGYGYKGGGHENVRIHHNHFEIQGAFAIESAHENEFGVEIDHNYINRCISIPKGGQTADPNPRGYQYSFWIHDNLLTDSYTVEGPRNHLRLSHNYIRIEKPNGRVYTHHGGINHGPVWIEHNVIENVDRALIWMNCGLAENIYVYHNTVYCADAGERTGAVLGAPRSDRLNNWVVHNNIIIAPTIQPRQLFPQKNDVGKKIIATHNVCTNITGIPENNYINVEPGLRLKGDRPWPFYAPAAQDSFVVERGVDVGLPFQGNKPDIGAYEFGEQRRFSQIDSTK